MALNLTEVTTFGRLMCTGRITNTTLPVHLDGKFFCDPTNTIDSVQVQIFVAAAFLFLMAAAVIGNAVVMWIIFSHKVMHHGFNYFLFNMALADLMIALCNVGTSWTFNLYYDWWYGDLCVPTTFFGIAPTTVSVFSMMSLSWDRCQAVVNPLRKRPLSRRRSLYAIGIIWIFSAVTALPNTIHSQITEFWFYNIPLDRIIVKRVCNTDASKFPSEFVNHLLFVIQYALPLFVLSFTFSRIACALRSTDVATDSSSKGSNHTKAKSKAVKMLALMVLAFMFCWLPYHLYHTFELGEIFPSDAQTAKYIYLFIYWVAMSSTAYNPIIYCFANERFRIGFRYVFRWMPCVTCKQEEYQFSQLFPDKLRSMAISMQLCGGKRQPKDHSTAGFSYHSQTELLQSSVIKDHKRKICAAL